MYKTDFSPDGFKWVNADDKDNSVYSFYRVSPNGKKHLLFVLNFTPVQRDSFKVGVPAKGKYKLVLGNDEKNQKKTLTAISDECDGFTQSLLIDIPKYGVCVYEFSAEKLDKKNSL